MRKRVTALLLAVFLLTACMPKAAAVTLAENAGSAILVDAATGTVLYESNADERLHPASVTKIMTLLLVMEALDKGQIHWEDTITASKAAADKGGSQIYLEENEQMALPEMLKAVVVASANDCACALAEHVAGSETAFVERMNQRAQELGMENTHFVNCTGLDDEPEAVDHLTTARDIAIMSRALLAHDEIRQYTGIWTDSVRNGEFGIANTNKLVRFYDGTTGLKTGYTSKAGFCMSASAMREGMELIAVVLHCASSVERFEAAKELLNYGFANYALAYPQPEDPLAPIPVILGTEASVQPVLASSDPIVIEKAQKGTLSYTTELQEVLHAPVAAGEQLGLVRICSEGTVLAEVPLVSSRDIPALTLRDLFLQLLRDFLFAGSCDTMVQTR